MGTWHDGLHVLDSTMPLSDAKGEAGVEKGWTCGLRTTGCQEWERVCTQSSAGVLLRSECLKNRGVTRKSGGWSRNQQRRRYGGWTTHRGWDRVHDGILRGRGRAHARSRVRRGSGIAGSRPVEAKRVSGAAGRREHARARAEARAREPDIEYRCRHRFGEENRRKAHEARGRRLRSRASA